MFGLHLTTLSMICTFFFPVLLEAKKDSGLGCFYLKK